MSFQHRPLNGTDRFPAELMAQILDNTKRDSQTLHACCFVCTAWHSYLIDSLYEIIRLESRSQLDRLTCTALIYPAVRGRLALARSVILRQGDMHAPGFAHVFPLLLGPHLHKVQDLTLQDCFMQPLHPSFFVMLPQLKDVKHLHLSMSPHVNFAGFQRIVNAFPHLEGLSIAESSSRTPFQLTPLHLLNLPCVPKLTAVHTIDVSPGLFHDLVAWLSPRGVCSTIRRLNIFKLPLQNRGAPLLDALLTHTASTLQYLRMYIPIEIFNDHWGFPQFLHLRVLDITILHWMNPMLTKDVQRELRSILASLTSPALETARLVFHCQDALTISGQDTDSRDATTDADREWYADLHAILARPIFSSLHRVTVVLYSHDRWKLMSAEDLVPFLGFLRRLFTPWCVRGIVNVACGMIKSGYTVLVVDEGQGPRWVESRLEQQRYFRDSCVPLPLSRHATA